MSRFLLVLLSIATFSALLTACNSTEYFREESAQRITAPVFLLPRNLTVSPFTIKVYERVYKEYQPAMIYIAGDGNQRFSLGDDPTPVEPTGLRLAAQDPKVNVIYMGRPCQYVGDSDECPETFWKEKRYSPEVVDAMDRALSTLKQAHHLTGFHLVGYDGGGAIAALLSSRRDDVLSLRTVAGILDPRFYANINGTDYPSGSLDPLNVAPSIAGLPQRHFVGQLDKKAPSAIAHSFEQTMGEPNCSTITLVDNADHIDGWAEQWKVLLALPVECPLTMRDQVIINPVDDAGTGVTKIYK